jgi:hypothetical protein
MVKHVSLLLLALLLSAALSVQATNYERVRLPLQIPIKASAETRAILEQLNSDHLDKLDKIDAQRADLEFD